MNWWTASALICQKFKFIFIYLFIYFIANSRAHCGQISNHGGTQKKSQKITLKLKDIVHVYKPQSRKTSWPLNYCLLVAKYHIYTSAREENDFCFHSYPAILRKRLLFEKTTIKPRFTPLQEYTSFLVYSLYYVHRIS